MKTFKSHCIKPILAMLVLSMFSVLLKAQERTYTTYYYQRVSLFESLSVSNQDIIFLGNSITDGCEWSELLRNQHIKNRGISGDIVMGVYDRLDQIVRGKPSKIFLLIGINDVSHGKPAKTIVDQISMIIDKIKKESPDTRLYIQSVLPVSDYYNMFTAATLRGDVVQEINTALKALTEREGLAYIDIYSLFVTQGTQKLDPLYSNDGLHLMGEAYRKWAKVLLPYVNE